MVPGEGIELPFRTGPLASVRDRLTTAKGPVNRHFAPLGVRGRSSCAALLTTTFSGGWVVG